MAVPRKLKYRIDLDLRHIQRMVMVVVTALRPPTVNIYLRLTESVHKVFIFDVKISVPSHKI